MNFSHRLLRALEIAHKAIPLLADRTASLEGAPAFRREKFLCETALLLDAAATVSSKVPELRTAVDSVARVLIPYARSAEVLAIMRMRPSMASELCVAHVSLTNIGFPDVRFDESVRKIVAGGYCVPERAPWKDIEADWLCQRSNLFSASVGLSDSINKTTLARGMDVLTCRREEMYAFTHALIYLTDFGRIQPDLPRSRSAILCDAEAALVRCIDEDDYDLAAELLFTWPYLRAPLSSSAEFVLSLLCRVEDEVGFLPSLSIRASAVREAQPDNRAKVLFDETYHTIYVMGLLAAAFLNAGDLPVANGPEGRSGSSTKIRALAGQRVQTPQWERAYHDLSERERDRLGELIATISLRRAFMGNDLRRVRDIVSVCVSEEIWCPPVLEAARLLRRFLPSEGAQRFEERELAV